MYSTTHPHNITYSPTPPHFHAHSQRDHRLSPGKPYWWGRLSTFDLLVRTSSYLDYLLIENVIYLFIKQANLMRRSTVLSRTFSKCSLTLLSLLRNTLTPQLDIHFFYLCLCLWLFFLIYLSFCSSLSLCCCCIMCLSFSLSAFSPSLSVSLSLSLSFAALSSLSVYFKESEALHFSKLSRFTLNYFFSLYLKTI